MEFIPKTIISQKGNQKRTIKIAHKPESPFEHFVTKVEMWGHSCPMDTFLICIL